VISPSNLVRCCIILFGAAIFALSCMQKGPRVPVTLTAAETPDAVPMRALKTTFTEFSHSVKEHRQFDCDSCHSREGRSLDLEFPGHEACIGCHLNQFTTRESQALCAICHKDMNASPPTMAEFPRRFNEGFRVKFDHASHDSGRGRPAQGCAACHAPAGAARTIPVGFQAHNTCYACHTPESKIGSCSVCHELGPYSRTSPGRYVFRAVFSHADHGGVGCSDCHSVSPGAPQGRQVTSIAAQEHNVPPTNNCLMCHNGSRAFGGNGANDFANCARCHTGSGFDMLPGG
jgi:hypothetical protein